MTFPSPPKVKKRWQLYFSWLPVLSRRLVGMVGDWDWCKDHVCKFDSRCLNTVFFFIYFSVTYCSPPFWFKGSVFESDHRKRILFARTHSLELFLFRGVHQWLIKICFFSMLFLKEVLSRPSIFNKMSWNFELQPRILLVSALHAGSILASRS
jgi:hypothetical protein